MRETRVFLSAVSHELGDFRRAVAALLTDRARGGEPGTSCVSIIHQDEFVPDWRTVRSMLVERLRECDAVVCLVGSAYGAEPASPVPEFGRASYTQLEYLLARRLAKPVFTFLAQEGLGRPHPDDDDEKRRLQQAFRRRLHGADHLWYEFASERSLLDLVARAPLPSEPTLHIPQNIPHHSIGSWFRGRDRLLAEMQALTTGDAASATDAARACVLSGLGGSGKSRAAVEFCWRHAGAWNAILWAKASTPADLDTSIAELSALLILNLDAQDEGDVAHRHAAVLRWLNTHPGWLLVIDNADTEAAARAVEALLPRLRGGHTVITSRLAHWSSGIVTMEVGPLEANDTAEYLLMRTEPVAHDRQHGRRVSPDDDVKAVALAQELGGLALAFEQAAAHIWKLRLSFDEYRARFDTRRSAVLAWHDPRIMQYPASVATTWLSTFEQLGPAERGLLHVLAWLAPDPIPVFLLDPIDRGEVTLPVLGDTDPRETLAQLTGFSLARFNQDGSAFSIHRLVQAITRDHLQGAAGADALQTAVLLADAAAPAGSDEIANWPRWTPLEPHVAALVARSASAGSPWPVPRLVNRRAEHLETKGRLREAEAAFERAVSLLGTASATDPDVNAEVHQELARARNARSKVLVALGHRDDAAEELRRALELMEKRTNPEPRLLAAILDNLGGAVGAAGDQRAELELRDRALQITEAHLGRNHEDMPLRLANVGATCRSTGDTARAEQLFREGLALALRNLPYAHPWISGLQNHLASVLMQAGRTAEVEQLLRDALARDEAGAGAGSLNAAGTAQVLVEFLKRAGREQEAIPLLARIQETYQRVFGIEDPRAFGTAIKLSGILGASGQVGQAERLLRVGLCGLVRASRGDRALGRHVRRLAETYARMLAEIGLDSAQADERLRAVLDGTGDPV